MGVSAFTKTHKMCLYTGLWLISYTSLTSVQQRHICIVNLTSCVTLNMIFSHSAIMHLLNTAQSLQIHQPPPVSGLHGGFIPMPLNHKFPCRVEYVLLRLNHRIACCNKQLSLLYLHVFPDWNKQPVLSPTIYKQRFVW